MDGAPEASRVVVARAVVGSVVATLAAAIFLPFIPVMGPLSLDDLLPLVAVALGVAYISLSSAPVVFDKITIVLALLAFLGLVSSLANATSMADFLRLGARSAGRWMFYATLIFLVRNLLATGDWPKKALYAVAIASTIQALFCLLAYVTRYQGPYGLGVVAFPDWSVLKGSVRVQGTFSGVATQFSTQAVSANFLAAYLVMTIPITFVLALATTRMSHRLAIAASMVLQIAVLYLTYTRAALLALAAPILSIGWMMGRRKLAMLALVLGFALTLAIPSVRTKFLSEGHDRYALWWASLLIIRDNPVVGVGDGNYEATLFGDQRYHMNEVGSAVTTSHNSILLSAAHSGVAAALVHVLLYLAIIIVAVGTVRRTVGNERVLAIGIAGAIAAFLVQDQFNNLSAVPKVATQFWFLLGILGALRGWSRS